MKAYISKVTGLQVGFTTGWVVLDSGVWRVLTQEEKTLVDAEYAVSELATAKEAKRKAIKEEFEVSANAPIVVNAVSYHGGFDSAIKLDAAKRLSEAAGGTEVTFFDVVNVGHTLSLVEAQDVIVQVSGKYQVDFATKQARMIAVDSAVSIQEVEVI